MMKEKEPTVLNGIVGIVVGIVYIAMGLFAGLISIAMGDPVWLMLLIILVVLGFYVIRTGNKMIINAKLIEEINQYEVEQDLQEKLLLQQLKDTAITERAIRTVEVKVAGTSFRQKEISSFLKPLFSSGELWKYEGVTNKEMKESYGDEFYELTQEEDFVADLINETDNEFNSKAIAVSLDGIKFGYLPEDFLEFYYNQIDNNNVITNSVVAIKGGPYKLVQHNDMGNEVVRTLKKDYYCSIELMFENPII